MGDPNARVIEVFLLVSQSAHRIRSGAISLNIPSSLDERPAEGEAAEEEGKTEGHKGCSIRRIDFWLCRIQDARLAFAKRNLGAYDSSAWYKSPSLQLFI